MSQEPDGSTHEVVIEREVTREKVTVKPAPMPPPPPPPPPPVPPRPLMTPSEAARAKKAGTNAVGCLVKFVGLAFGFTFCCILFVAIFGPPPDSSSRSSSGSSSSASETGSTSAASSAARVYTEGKDLRALPDGTYPILIATSSLAEDWDATLALPWAMTYAKDWSKDAVLLRIEVIGAGPSGRLRLSQQFNEVVYTFWPEVSPDPANEDVERTTDEVSRAKKGATTAPTPRTRELSLRIGNGKAFAVIAPIVSPAGGKPSDFWPNGQPALSPLTMLKLFEQIGTWRRIRASDLFNGELNYERREGWTWTLTERGDTSTFRVRASDGQRVPNRASSR